MTLQNQIEKLLPFLTRKIATILEESQSELASLNWHTGESNTDLEFSELARKCCYEAFDILNKNAELSLSVEVPDLLLTFSQREESLEKKIELKSTKSSTGKVPGSMIRSLDPNVWTIFCLRKSESKVYEFRYGRYYLGMEYSDYDRFQDRSPRPTLSFFKYQKTEENPNQIEKMSSKYFIKHYARTAINRILHPKLNGHSWQDDLVKEIIREVLKNPKKFKDV